MSSQTAPVAAAAAAPQLSPPSAGPGPSALSRDTHTALRNGIKLAISLVATWGVGLVVRFWLPRYLGPERFGTLSFAEGLAATVLGCAGLGLDTYVSKEIPVRPRHASDFYGGTVVVRVLLSALLVGVLMAVPLGARDPAVRLLLLTYGVGWLASGLNGTLAVMLQANTTVDELVIANVTAKIAWGLGIIGAILLQLPLIAIAIVFLGSEAIKHAILYFAAGRRVGLRFRTDLVAARMVVVASAGFYANSLALVLGWRLDVALLGFLAHDRDVGWYGASQSLAQITLLLTPLISSVLMPLLTRAHARSPEEMLGVMRRALEGLILITTPVALFLALGATLWIRIAFGAAYAPAVGSLRMLAPLFVLVYLAILLSMAMVVLGRGWTLTVISLGAIVVNAGVALLAVPRFGAWLGEGGAGTGMALAAVSKEIFTTILLLIVLGRGFLDRPRRALIGRTVAVALGTTAVHLALAQLGLWRLPLDLVAYLAFAVGLGVLRPATAIGFARELISARR